MKDSTTARLATAATFAVSGVAKAADPIGTRQAVEGFGVPAWAVTGVVAVLPTLEITNRWTGDLVAFETLRARYLLYP